MEIPDGPTALTTEWLTAALQTSNTIQDTTVQAFHTHPAAEGKGAIGQLVRVSLTYDRPDTSAPRSMVAKFSAADPVARTQYHAFGVYEVEVRFYQQIAGQVQLRTPNCYYSDIDLDSGACVLLLEDLAPALNGDRLAGCTREEAALAIREIAGFHARWWDSPQLDAMGWLREPSAFVEQEHGQYWQPFLEKAGDRLEKAFVGIGEQLVSHISTLATPLYEPPLTIIHADYQLENLFFSDTEDGLSLAVIDWQTVTRGCGLQDVAVFLCQNVSSPVRRANERQFLKTYHTILRSNDVRDYSFDRCFDDYRRAILCYFIALIFAIGGGIFDEAQEQAILDIVLPRHVAAILDLNAQDLLPT